MQMHTRSFLSMRSDTGENYYSLYSKIKTYTKSRITAFGRSIDNTLLETGGFFERAYRDYKNFIPHRFVARPLYKSLSQRVGRPVACILSFTACSLIFHQLPFSVTKLILGKVLVSNKDILFNVIWIGLGGLVAYKKFRRPDS